MSSVHFDVHWHRFGRGTRGYRTLDHSAGLGASASEQLERFAWGQTSDLDYLDSLVENPAVWVEPLDGLVAITRVARGANDKDGRTTLLFDSLVSSVDVYTAEILPRLTHLLAQAEAPWNGDVSQLAEVPLDVRLEQDEFTSALLPQVEASKGQKSIIAPPGSAALATFVAAMRAATEANGRIHSFAYRALTDALRVDVVLVDRCYRPERADHSRVNLGTGLLDAQDRLETIERSDRAAARASQRTARQPTRAVRRKTPNINRPYLPDEGLEMNTKTIAAFVILGVLVASLGIANLAILKTLQTQGTGLSQRLEERTDSIEESMTTKSLFAERVGHVDVELNSLKEALGLAETELDEAVAVREELSSDFDQVLAELSALNASVDQLKMEDPNPAIAELIEFSKSLESRLTDLDRGLLELQGAEGPIVKEASIGSAAQLDTEGVGEAPTGEGS